jgi:hypothetical protein
LGLLFIGPRAQEVLRPYLGTKLEAYYTAAKENNRSQPVFSAKMAAKPWSGIFAAVYYCFSPAESEAQRNAQKRAGRKTPLTPSHRTRKPKKNPKRAKRDHYDETSYRNAVFRACDKAFQPPEPLATAKGETAREWQARLTEAQQGELARWQKEHRWHPNRLRHNRATELRCHGLDVVKTILGHTKVETSQIYAEKDLTAAKELVAKIG